MCSDIEFQSEFAIAKNLDKLVPGNESGIHKGLESDLGKSVLLCKSLKRELKRLAHPHHVSVLKVDGQAVEERVVASAGAFIAAYLLVLLAGALVVSWDNYGFQESFAASLTCISNVGPGLGILGPMENFSILSPLSKLVLLLEMLMGRLELMPLLALLLRSTWRD